MIDPYHNAGGTYSMETSRVALVPVNTYEQPAVDAAVREAIGLLGGIGQFVQQEIGRAHV